MDERAKSILHYLHGKDFDTDSETERIKGKTLSRKIRWIEGIKALKHWSVSKPIVFMIGIAFLKEFGGHEGMVSFSSHILENQQAMDPKVASLFYPICLIIGAIVLFMNTYAAEVALDHQKQLFGGGIGFSVRIGLFIAYFAGIWLNFRWLAVLGLILTCVFCFFGYNQSCFTCMVYPAWYG